jgi:hypothetical protein
MLKIVTEFVKPKAVLATETLVSAHGLMVTRKVNGRETLG